MEGLLPCLLAWADVRRCKSNNLEHWQDVARVTQASTVICLRLSFVIYFSSVQSSKMALRIEKNGT